MSDTQGTRAQQAAEPVGKPSSLWSDAWHDLRRNPLFVVSAIMITALLLMAAWPSLFSPIDAFDATQIEQARALEGPSAEHWFGLDQQGRDLYAGVVYGARASIIIGLGAAASVMVLGGLLGLFAGFYGGWFDVVLSRVADTFFAFPIILGGLLILAMVGEGSAWTVVLAILVVGWPMTFRVARAAVLTAKSQDYVLAARGLGAGNRRLMFRHVMPNSLAPVLVVATMNLGVYIAVEAALSYLGVGITSPNIAWGLMIADGQERFFEAPHLVIFPAIFLAFTVLSFVLLGDAVRDALDPKLR